MVHNHFSLSSLRGASFLALAIVCASCGLQSAKFHSEKQVNIAGSKLRPAFIVQTSSGDILVGGSFAATFGAIQAVDSQGKEKWLYARPVDESRPQGNQSEVVGAIELPDNTYFICGTTRTLDWHPVGFVAVLDRSGRTVWEHLILPSGSEDSSNSVKGCFSWSGGIGVLEWGVAKATHARLHLMKSDGSIVWDKEGEEYQATSFSMLEDHALVLLNSDPISEVVTVWKVDAKGLVGPRRNLPGRNGFLLQPINSKTLGLLAYSLKQPPQLYMLDDHLNDVRSPITVGDFSLDSGAGFVRPNGSVVLYGHLFSHETARAFVDTSGLVSTTLLQGVSTVTASALDSNHFLEAHLVAQQPAQPVKTELILSWDSFN